MELKQTDAGLNYDSTVRFTTGQRTQAGSEKRNHSRASLRGRALSR
jgi:hypothetical protein